MKATCRFAITLGWSVFCRQITPPSKPLFRSAIAASCNLLIALASCLASLVSGSETEVEQLLCFVAGQIQDRTEVSHLRGDVRFAEAGSFYELLFAGCAISRGGPARNRAVFINSGRGRGKKGPLPESRGTADLALCLRSFADAKCKEREAPSEGPSVDENHPISGRTPPRFVCIRELAKVENRAIARPPPAFAR